MACWFFIPVLFKTFRGTLFVFGGNNIIMIHCLIYCIPGVHICMCTQVWTDHLLDTYLFLLLTCLPIVGRRCGCSWACQPAYPQDPAWPLSKDLRHALVVRFQVNTRIYINAHPVSCALLLGSLS